MKIIIDTDPGVDDILAILFLLASPEVSIELISVTFGNTTLERAFHNVLKLYAIARRQEELVASSSFPLLHRDRPTILAKGAEKPLQGSLDLAEYFHGFDGLSGVSTSHPEYNLHEVQDTDPALSIATVPAHQAMIQILKSEPPDSVHILTLGPLTTIAQAIQTDRKAMSRAARIVSMGGALDVAGNTSATAEFNFFADPYGAEVVMRAVTEGLCPMVLLPLDVTTPHRVHFDNLIATSPGTLTPATSASDGILYRFLDTVLARPRTVMRDLGYTHDCFEMHDPMAAFYLVDTAPNAHPAEWKLQKRRFVMERVGEWTKGMCVVDRRGMNDEDGAVRTRDGIPGEEAPPKPAEIPAIHDTRLLEVDVVVQTPGNDAFNKAFLSKVYSIKS